jgi:hypothetical protein
MDDNDESVPQRILKKAWPGFDRKSTLAIGATKIMIDFEYDPPRGFPPPGAPYEVGLAELRRVLRTSEPRDARCAIMRTTRVHVTVGAIEKKTKQCAAAAANDNADR